MNITNYTRFNPDKDAIIPICDNEYFEDDIVGRFVKFVELASAKRRWRKTSVSSPMPSVAKVPRVR